jgi:nitrile hydratase accessory protein
MSDDLSPTAHCLLPAAPTYDRRRNLVRRADGRMVNVARSRGHLFVCSEACCCGRVEDGMAPVPVDLYHAEWERRRLRNIVHLTIGGCLGPCALANVVLLLFDGQSLWFHSVNSDTLVLALYDYIETMLDADHILPTPEPLATLTFTADTWQPRPDNQPVDDLRQWEQRKAARLRADLPPRPPSPKGRGRAGSTDAARALALPSGGTGGTAPARRWLGNRTGSSSPTNGGRGGRSAPEDWSGPDPLALPRKNGEMVFEEPWESRAFGMAVALTEDQCYPWEDFRQRLIAEIGAADARNDPSGYYERWLAAFEGLLTETGILTREELDERTFEFEFGERDDVF